MESPKQLICDLPFSSHGFPFDPIASSSDNVATMLVGRVWMFIFSLPQAMDNKALTHFLPVTSFSAVTQCALWIISHMTL